MRNSGVTVDADRRRTSGSAVAPAGIVVDGVSQGTNLTNGGTLTIPLPVALGTGDVIVFGVTYGSTVAPTSPSGGGATWVTYNVPSAPEMTLLIGYGGSAGTSSFTYTAAGSQTGSWQCLVISGCAAGNPVVSETQGTGTGTSATTGTTQTFGANNMALAACGAFTSTPLTATCAFSTTASGLTFTTVTPNWGTSASTRGTDFCYGIPAADTSGTITGTWSNTNVGTRIAAIVLAHA